MTCGYCQFGNTADDHRCGRCGRRLLGTATPAPPHLAQQHIRLAVQALGANALAAVRVPVADAQSAKRAEEPPLIGPAAVVARTPARKSNETSLDAAATLDSLPRSRTMRSSQPSSQPSLFGAELQPKIIPFETIYRPAPEVTQEETPVVSVSAPSAAKTVRSKPAVRRTQSTDKDAQATLDFLPPLKNAPRSMKTNVEAVIFCEADVASPVHRATAAALDLSMILIGFGSVLFIFQAWAHPVFNRNTFLLLGAMLGLVAFFYSLVFAIAGTVSPGMKWTRLRLINFDGFPLDGRTQALRFLGSWISVMSGGLGILWALLDEEHLSWHDHMSKSFPTLQESESTVVRPR